MAPEPAFGLDLSGYSGERSSLAEFRQGVSEGYLATVYRGHPFARAGEGRNRLAQIVREEREALALLLRAGVLFVDVPIDLQSLPMPAEPEFVWELTARPVDFAYSGLRPFADRIGAPVARFQHIASDTPSGARSNLDVYWKPTQQHRSCVRPRRATDTSGRALPGMAVDG